MSNGNGIKRHFRGVPKTPATVQSDEESSSNDSSTVMENDSSTTPKKHISAPVSMFEFQGPVTGKNMVQFKCLLGCIPPKAISTAINSRGNLKRHVKQKHRSRLNEFIQECKNLDCLKGLPNNTLTVSSEKSKSFIQPEISFDGNYNHNRHLPQSVIDSAILDYLIEDVLPMYTVEKKGFRKFVQRLGNRIKIRCRRFFTKKVNSLFVEGKKKLIEALSNAKYACTTADCWTSRRKSFIGVTVHWLDFKMKRKSACLAVRRIKGSHTYDVIARELEAIHDEFQLTSKLTATVTDSGSNFVKAFRLFGKEIATSRTTFEEANEAHEISSSSSNSSYSGDVEESFNETENLNDSDDEDDIVFFPITKILNSNSDASAYSLPPHRRCVCHSLNLLATADISKITDRGFLNIFESVDSKLRSIWNKQSRSSKSSDTIKKELGKLFVTPNDTRWNSYFCAMKRVKYFILKKPLKLTDIFKHFNIAPLGPVEEAFIMEYVKVMAPVAAALDILQGDKNISIGYLLPTLTVLQTQLEKLKRDSGIKHCKALINALCNGLTKRFSHMFLDRELRLAAMLHPRFKLFWIQEDKDDAIEMLKEEFQDECERSGPPLLNSKATTPESESEESDDAQPPRKKAKKDFFKSLNPRKALETEELDRFLSDGSAASESILNFPILSRLLLRYNTALPSSASVERLFSVAGSIFKPTRSRLKDKNFEMLLFLKVNGDSNFL